MKKEIDYSKMPEHVWQKVLKDFVADNDRIEVELQAIQLRINNLKDKHEPPK